MLRVLILAGGAAVAAAMAPVPAQADIITYTVTDATSGPCSHGLWVNTLRSGCDRRFSFQDGSAFSIDTDAGTGTFNGTAINSSGEVATLNLTLSGFLDSLDGTGFTYKAGGGPYDPATQDYFTSVSGFIGLSSPDRTDGPVLFRIDGSEPLAGDTVFQFGSGANDKSDVFGGSAWLNILNPNLARIPHWDINFTLTQQPGTPVPAPAGLLLFGIGLAGAWGARRAKLSICR